LAGSREFRQNSFRNREEKSSGMGFMAWFFIIIAIGLIVVGYLFRDQLFETEKNTNDSSENINENLTRDYDELLIEKYELEQTIVELNEELEAAKNLSNDNKELQDEIDILKYMNRQLEDEALEFGSELRKLDEEVRILYTKNKDLSNQIAKLRTESNKIKINGPIDEKLNSIAVSVLNDLEKEINKSSNEEPSQVPQDSFKSLASEPKMTDRQSPRYPSRAIQRGLEGKVTLLFDIDTNGKPRNIEVSSGANSILNNEAIRALERSTFRPALDSDGKPYYYIGFSYTYTFRLD
tara:strand:+ start:2308 stop:3189 length:882 start_codon:yes stop_codon:yes gene_type:complete